MKLCPECKTENLVNVDNGFQKANWCKRCYFFEVLSKEILS